MLTYKKLILFLAPIILFQNICTATSNEPQIRNYIDHVVDSLFMPKNHNEEQKKALNQFKDDITNKVIKKLGSHPFPYLPLFPKEWDNDKVYKYILEHSIEFLENNIKQYTLDATNGYFADESARQKLVKDVVQKLMKEVHNKTNKLHLENGVLTGYIGTPLIHKIHQLIDKEIQKEKERQEKLVSRNNCPVCSQKYNGANLKKITLSCSHAICLKCLKEAWKKQGANVFCSKCNTKINISIHVKPDWGKSDYSGYQYGDNNYYPKNGYYPKDEYYPGK